MKLQTLLLKMSNKYRLTPVTILALIVMILLWIPLVALVLINVANLPSLSYFFLVAITTLLSYFAFILLSTKSYFSSHVEGEFIERSKLAGASVFFVSKEDDFSDKFFAIEKKRITSLYRYIDDDDELYNGTNHIIIIFEKYLKTSIDRVCTMIRSYGSFMNSLDPKKDEDTYIVEAIETLKIPFLYKLELKSYLRLEEWEDEFPY